MKLRINPARSGALWVKTGVQTFFKQPMALVGLFFMFMALMILVGQIPFIGFALAIMLLPAMTLGLMSATLDASRGNFPMPVVLLAAFRASRSKSRAMLVLGILYAIGSLLAMGASWLVDGGTFAGFYLGTSSPTPEIAMSTQFQTAMWLFIGLHLPLSLMFWHAPALIFWHQLAPLKSLFFSLVACLRNFRAFVVFMLTWLAVMLLIGLGFTIVVALLGNPAWAGDLLFPVAMLTGSIYFTSLYFSFRDCFESEDATGTGVPPVP